MKWVEKEMQTVQLNDIRLNRRAIRVVEDVARMGESPPDAMRSKAALDGAYRLMNNSKVSPQALLEPHLVQSIARTTEHSRVLLVQDTTEVDLTKPNRQVQQAGPLECESRRGFFLHPLIAYTTQGVAPRISRQHALDSGEDLFWSLPAGKEEAVPRTNIRAKRKLSLVRDDATRSADC